MLADYEVWWLAVMAVLFVGCVWDQMRLYP